ncbi:hypothetical protein J4416_00395 [Candidatus Pacearchaeota archaeon]|nr:hypothetical protein [Candidatus Pacearchaeota archaeon]
MFGIKKKNSASELPDFPSMGAPSMRDYQRTTLPPIEAPPQDEEQIHGLPSFPDSLMHKGFSQSMIKSAVEDEDQNLPELPEWDQKSEKTTVPVRPVRTVELEEWTPKTNSPQIQQNRPMDTDIRTPPPSSPKPSISQLQPSSKRPIFIKLDKFKEARDSLIKISEKLDQMDELLKMVKDLKSKENEEITSWEKDMENIKMRISFINKEIFENVY